MYVYVKMFNLSSNVYYFLSMWKNNSLFKKLCIVLAIKHTDINWYVKYIIL